MQTNETIYARSVYLRQANWRSALFRAFLQPLGRLSEEEITEIGRVVREPYLYLGPPDHDLTKLTAEAAVLDSEGTAYKIIHAQKIYKGDAPLYIRAILEK